MKRKRDLTFKIWVLGILTCLTVVANAGTNQNVVYQGRIVRPDGTVPNTGTISFSLSIYSPSPKKCLLYSENQTVNMAGSQGMFSLKLGEGTRTTGVPTSNLAFIAGTTIPGLTCADGSTSYTPAASDDRDLVVAFNDNGTVVNLSAVNVQSVPYALQATKIDGWGVNDIVKVHPTTGSPTTFTTAEMATAKTITGLTCANNEIIKWNGTAWACSPDATGAAPGDAGYGTSKGVVSFDTDAATSGITVASGVAKLSNTGVTANTYGTATAVPTIAIDLQGRITSATSTAIALPVSQLTQSSATNGQVLKWNGSAWAPAADLGVTSDASYAAKGVVQFDTDAATSGISIASGVAKVNTGVGANQIVKLDGTGKLPAVDGSALTNITATGYSGVLPIANGGTNSSTALSNDRVMVSSSGKIVEAPAMTNGQLLIGSTGGAPEVATVGSSNGISITTGAGSLSIATNATANNTASTIVSRDASGNFAAGAVSFSSTVLRGSSSGNLTLRAAPTVTDYTLTWPAAVGSAGQFLTTDASGNLSWGSPAAIADASYAGKGAVQFLTDASTSGITVSSGVASVNAGTGANQIVKLNGSSQLPAVDGSLLTNLSAANIASGVLPIARGGTNNGSLGVTAGGILYMDGSKAMTTAAGTSGQALLSAGAGAPAFGNLSVPAGGTGTTSFAANSLVMANGTGSALTGMTCSLGQILKWDGTAWSCSTGAGAVADAGYTSSNKGVVAFDTDASTSGITVSSGVAKVNAGTGANQIVKLDGTGKLPALDGSALTGITATGYSGVLPIANGGTNSSTALNNDRLMFSSSGAIVEMPAMTNGQIVVGSTGAAPTVATLGSSNGISITTGAGSLSIATNATPNNTASAIVSRDASGNFAAGAASFSSAVLRGSTSGTLTVTVPTTVTDYTIRFPGAVGSAGQFLTTDASGNLSWGSPAAIADSSYSVKGAVQFDTNAVTSGINVSSGIASVNAGTGANQIIKLNASAQLPAVDGSLLTNLGAGQISSGTLPIARGGTNSGTTLTNNKVMVSSGGAIVEGNGFGSAKAASTFVTRDTNGDFAAGVGTFDSTILKGGTSGTLTMTVPTTVTPYTLTWPSGVGSGGQFLTTDASGNLSWGSPAAVPDGSYSVKGSLQGLTDAATSGLNIASGVVSVNAGTGANQIVKLNGSSQLPAVDGSLLTNLSAANISSGVLPIARGGTNSGTALNNDRLMLSSGGAIVEAPAMTNGQIVVGSTGAAPTVATLGSSNGISITTGAGSLSIATNATSANTANTIVSRDASGNFAAGAGSFSSTLLRGSSSGTLTVSVPATVTDYTIKFPGAVGTAGQFLTTDASGNLSWGSPAAISDSSYSVKGAVQFLTDAPTSGIDIASGVAKVNTGTGANQIVKLNGSSQLPALDGSLLTNLSASQITNGVLPVARGGTNSGTTLTNNKVMVSSGGAIVEGVGFSSTKSASTFVTRDTNGDFAAGVGTFDSAVLKGATSGTLTMTVPTTVTPYTLTWPSGVGTAGQFLTTDASGNLSWGSPAAISDASYSVKGAVQGLTDAATSGLNIASGVISVNAGTGANQIVKLNGSSQLPALDGSLLTNLSAAQITAGTLPIARGGTAATSFAANSLIMANGTGSAFTSMTCSLGEILKWNGTAWACSTGAGAIADAAYTSSNKGVVAFDTDAATSGVSVTSGVAKVNAGTAANQIVKLNGSAQLPAVDGSLLTNLSAGNISSGVLPIARGGTNSGTTLNNNRMMMSSGGAIVEAPAMTNGQIVVGSTGAAPAVATLGSSNGISITTGAGSLSIATNATDANTASTIVSRNASGNFAAGAITNTSNILKGSSSGNLTMTVPGTVTSYTLTWPGAVGSAGSFLTTDASGNLSWGSPAAVADASYAAKGAVQGLTDAATSGLIINSGVISVNSGTAANQIVKLNGSSQLPAVDGSLLTNLSAANIASGVLPIARGGTNNGSLGVTAGGILYMDGSKAMTTAAGTSGQALLSTGAGAPAFGNLGIGAGGTGATSFAANSLIIANGTGTALSSMTCAPGQILKWNAGGTAWECAADATGTSPGDAGYTSANKGILAFDVDAATSGISITSGVAKVNTGVAANQILKLNGSAQLPAVDGSLLTNLSATNIASGVLPIARGGTNSGTTLTNNKVMVSSGGAIVEGNGFGSAKAASTFVTRDTNGDFAAGVGTFDSTVLKGSTSGTVTLRSQASVTSYTLTLPGAVGANGSFLTTDASGNLSWGSPAAVADASYAAKGAVQGLTDAATSGLNISSGVISVNSGTAANQIVKLNASAQLPAVDGSLLTNLSAANIASGVLPIARGGTNNGSLGVTAGGMLYADGSKLMTTSAGTSGQAMISSGAGAPAFGTLGFAGGGTGATSFTANGLIMANSGGTALTSKTCANTEILKWNGTTWACAPDATGSSPGDAGYTSSNKGIVAFDVDAATSGISITTGVAKVNAGTAANQIVKLNGSAQLPAVDGSLLTNLSTSQLTSGVLPIARGGTNSGTTLTNGKVMVSSGGAIVEGVAFGSSKVASTFVTRDTNGDFAAGVGTFDSTVLKGSTSGTVTLRSQASVTSYTLTLPATVGSNGSFLTTDASGNLSWGSPAAVSDATYASKGAVQGLTDAATSGLIINSGIISVNSGTSANQIVKLNASSQLPAVDGSLLTNLSAANIASGVLPIARGGTNNGSLGVTAGGVVYGDGSKLMMSAAGTSGQALISAGAGVPVFGTLGVAGGGTGATTLTANGILMGNGTSAVSAITGTANQVLRVPAGGGAPTFGTAMIAGGGTGATSFAANSLIMANGTGSALTHITCSSGEVLKWSGTAWGCATDSTGAAGDAGYTSANKGLVAFDTDMATSGINVASGVAKVNTGVGANQILKLNGSSQIPAVDGSLLTNIGAGQISSGTLPIARGGTNSSSALTNGKVMVSSAGAIVEGAAYSSTNTASTFVMRDASGNFAATEGSFDKTILRGLTSGTLTMQVPSVTTSYTLTWPSGVGSANTFLKTDATGGLSWSAIDGSALTGLNAGNISTGVLPIARGGTNNGSLGVTAGGILYMDGTKAMTTSAGTSGQALISAGAGAPAFGTLGVAGGGTGLTSFTAGDMMYASGATAISKLGIGASGTVLTSTGSAPQWSSVGSLGFYSDGGNTFTATATIGTNSAHDLQIETGGTPKMTVESGGNVGIGTTDPFYKFDVYGADSNVIARIMNGTSTGTRFPAVQVMNYNGGFGAGYPAIQLNSSRGNSGAPAAVGSGDKLGAIDFSGSVDNAYNYHNAAGIDSYATQAFATGSPGSGGADLRFYTTANSTRTKSERMRIEEGGFVGIGITDPVAQLHIHNGSGTSEAKFSNGTTGVLASDGLAVGITSTEGFVWVDDNMPLVLATNNTERMRVHGDGKVGIGLTATPAEKVEISGGLKVDGGQAYVDVQTSSAASPLTFDAALGNSMVWSTGATATPTVNIHNMKAGGSYLLVVQGTGTGAVTINCYSNAGTTALPSSFMPANGNRIDGTLDKTMYNIISDGTNCLITWVSGF